jgi:hypothetical protein
VVDDTVVGGVSHRFVFKTQKHTGKPAFLEVQRLSGNKNCASCERPANPGETVPHNVVTAHHANLAIDDALKALGLFDSASQNSQLYNLMQGIAKSTGWDAPLPTKGTFQKQCATCEGRAPRDPDGEYLAAQSLMQRAAGASRVPNGVTADDRGMDKQFENTTSTDLEKITDKRIANLISSLDEKIRKSRPPSSAPIDILRTNDATRAAFLLSLQLSLKNRVK